MKKLFIVIAVFFALALAIDGNAQKAKTVHVKSYTTKKGKHVDSHYRSRPTRHRKYSYINPIIFINKENYA